MADIDVVTAALCLRWQDRRSALTTVLFVRVVLAVVVSVAHPGATDAFAVVAVEVQRRAGGKHCKHKGAQATSLSAGTNKQTNKMRD